MTTNSVHDAFVHASRLLESGWCQGGYAKDKDGNWCSELSDDADSFCVSGAIIRASKDTGVSVDELFDIFNHTLDIENKEYPWEWNDMQYQTKENVISVVLVAAKAALSSDNILPTRIDTDIDE